MANQPFPLLSLYYHTPDKTGEQEKSQQAKNPYPSEVTNTGHQMTQLSIIIDESEISMQEALCRSMSEMMMLFVGYPFNKSYISPDLLPLFILLSSVLGGSYAPFLSSHFLLSFPVCVHPASLHSLI
ncbi:hypothetical protein TNCT_733611 [Trichonephila clavata]|uniref:Uncharacterized protein n=1 Tax=Trichonephila clavata TaxID=2740835 RepID=A0A8X6HCU3_TRICU|nr:hypothetical protein TNCT_733611 [Trichonephila clavata]